MDETCGNCNNRNYCDEDWSECPIVVDYLEFNGLDGDYEYAKACVQAGSCPQCGELLARGRGFRTCPRCALTFEEGIDYE